MDAYFNENRLEARRYKKKHDDWKKKLEEMKLRSNIKEEIIRLARYDQKMQDAIIQEKEYTKEVTFSYLDLVFQKTRVHERRKYKALCETLAKMRIILKII